MPRTIGNYGFQNLALNGLGAGGTASSLLTVVSGNLLRKYVPK